jgi:molybdopterin molybdotransferase
MSVTLIHPDDALNIILQSSLGLKTEDVAVTDSLGRVVAEDIKSPIDLPAFDRSAMDGYAYNSKSRVEGYRVVEIIAAGSSPEKKINYGECARIMTGARLPAGVDKVVKFENTAEQNGLMQILSQENNNNIRYRGEDLQQNDLLLAQGNIIRAQEIAALSAVGLDKIKVSCQPHIGLLITGSEIVNPGTKILADKIFNSNGPQLCNQIKSLHCNCTYYGIVKDERSVLRAAIEQALLNCDLVLISGGVSKGDFDFVPDVLQELGVDLKLQQVAMKPGKPLLFGVKEKALIFGLPGNPVSTFITFEIFVKPLIYKMMGHNFIPQIYAGKLAEAIERKHIERTEFLPVFFDGFKVKLIAYYGSANINALCQANALLRIDRGVAKIAKDEVVNVRSF